MQQKNFLQFESEYWRVLDAAPRIGWINSMMKEEHLVGFGRSNKIVFLIEATEAACRDATSGGEKDTDTIALAQTTLLALVKLNPASTNIEARRMQEEKVPHKTLTLLAKPELYENVIEREKEKWRSAIGNFLMDSRHQFITGRSWFDAAILSMNCYTVFDVGSLLISEIHAAVIKERLLYHMACLVKSRPETRFQDFFNYGDGPENSEFARHCSKYLLELLARQGKLDSSVNLKEAIAQLDD